MNRYVLEFQEIDQAQVATAGGKGAHLGELLRIDGIRVPPGFCITTDAYRHITSLAPSLDALLDQLSGLKPDARRRNRHTRGRRRGHHQGTRQAG
jgi:rifampicin phosphotransferase